MTEDDKAGALKAYAALIYPVWASIYSRWVSTWGDEKSESELSVLHRMDIAVYNSGHKPQRSSFEFNEDKEKFRRVAGSAQEVMR